MNVFYYYFTWCPGTEYAANTRAPKLGLTSDRSYGRKNQSWRQTIIIVSKVSTHGKHVILTWTSALVANTKDWCTRPGWRHTRVMKVSDDDTQELWKSALTTHKSYGSQRWRQTRVMEDSTDDTQELWKSALTTHKSYWSQRWRQTRVIVTKVSVDGRHEVWSLKSALTRGMYGTKVSADDRHEAWSRISALTTDTRLCQRWRQTRGMVTKVNLDGKHEVLAQKPVN